MPLDYDPKQAASCWPEGDYAAVLELVEDKVSKAGNDMQVWTIRIYNDAGNERTIKEYVTASSAFKLRQLAGALGKNAEFKAGKFQADDHIGSGFTAGIIIEAGGGEYDDQNKIGKYKSSGTTEAPSIPTTPRPTTRTGAVAGSLKAKAKAQTVTSPISDDEVIKDEDIPF